MTESPLSGKRLAVIGCGNMASAIVGGIIDRGLVTADQIVGSDKDAGRRDALAQLRGIATADSNLLAIRDADLILLAVKPQNALDVLVEVGGDVTAEQLVISIMAGIPTRLIETRIPAPVPVIRVMPNTPALVGCGATTLAKGRYANDEHLDLARAIFSAVGVCVDVEEHALDAVTGLSGSGPGYIFFLVEALIQAGRDVGLSPRVAQTLVAHTLLGSARLLLEDPQRRSPGELREAVTSPGGTTAAGLEVLKREHVAEALRMAIHAATTRSRELGRPTNAG
jgi:pyrroline-5-carboxylate reductase